ncbi:MAG: transcriptional regulator [Desulfobacteraceae bacterium]|nr:MAG: transcriptional regulator [Desulfobacteraceae bacterium]
MKNAAQLQKRLQTLSDINRLRIIHCIGAGEIPVGDIVNATQLSQPLVSHHLKALKTAGIVIARRKGPFVYYRLSSPELLEVLGILSSLVQDAGEESSTDPPLFPCPPWWIKMHEPN